MDISTRSDLCALQDVIYHKELCDLDRPVIRKARKFILLNKLSYPFRADAKHLADVLYSDHFGIVPVHRFVCLAHCYISLHRDSPFGAEEFGKKNELCFIFCCQDTQCRHQTRSVWQDAFSGDLLLSVSIYIMNYFSEKSKFSVSQNRGQFSQ